MATATKRIIVTAKAPNGQGTFDGDVFYNPPGGDHDGERIQNFTNVPATNMSLRYMHVIGDDAAIIGKATVTDKGNGHLLVLGRLDIHGRNKMAEACFERLLLPSDDPHHISQLSVGFDYDNELSFKDKNGVKVLVDCRLLEVSLVKEGAQQTTIRNVKNTKTTDTTRQLRCRCGRWVDAKLHEPIPGVSIDWTVTPCCGILYGYSPLSTPDHVAEMDKVRHYVYPDQVLTPSQVDTVVEYVTKAVPTFLRDAVARRIYGWARDGGTQKSVADLKASIDNAVEAWTDTTPPERDDDLRQQLDALVGKTSSTPDRNNATSMYRHVVRHHGPQLVTDGVAPERVAAMALDALNWLHDRLHLMPTADHSALLGAPEKSRHNADIWEAIDAVEHTKSAPADVTADVERMQRDVHAQKERELREQVEFTQNQLTAQRGIDLRLLDEQERERQTRDLADIEQRSAEREEEAAVRDRAREHAVDRDWHNDGAMSWYSESLGAEPTARSESSETAPVVVHDEPVHGEGERFTIPGGRLIPPPETYRVDELRVKEEE